MKKLFIILSASIVLAGCNATLGALENEFRLMANMPINNLTIDGFCQTVKEDPSRYNKAWNGALFEFTGKITVAQKSGKEYTVGLEKNKKERLFAKVSSLNGLKIGDVATIQGNISPANFEPNRKECMMLLDNAKFIK